MTSVNRLFLAKYTILLQCMHMWQRCKCFLWYFTCDFTFLLGMFSFINTITWCF